METYGKNSKKKTIMGSFASFRNSQYNHTQKNRTNKRGQFLHSNRSTLKVNEDNHCLHPITLGQIIEVPLFHFDYETPFE